jgi:ornithine cyclodeaminase/alanine dehydrogenase
MTKPQGTLLLNRSDITSLLDLQDYLRVVEDAFRLHAEGRTLETGLLHVDAVDGEFHVKAGGLKGERTYFALKVNGGFFQNRARFDLPNIQGTIILCDGESGYPLALMDSTAITLGRTGATTGLAARLMARQGSSVTAVCGCGNQGRIQLRAVAHVLPIREVYAWDEDQDAAQEFAAEMAGELSLEVRAVAMPGQATRRGDVCITCTPAHAPFVSAGMLAPGAFVAAVGADSPEKHEVEPELLASATVVVDLLEQCAAVGDLHHALERDLMARDDVYAELGEIVAGRKPGRRSAEEIVVFDATGTGLQDAAGAAAAYEKAQARGVGSYFDFFA